MSVNYSHVSLNIIYDGKIVNILNDISLEKLDSITGLTISKMDLMCKLLKIISSDEKKYYLKYIFEQHGSISYLDDFECNFNFVISVGGTNGIFIPVLYNQSSICNNDIVDKLSRMNNISSVLKMYLKYVEKDEKNVFIILDALKYDDELSKKNITIDDLSFYGYLVNLRKKKVVFDTDTNNCYISLKDDCNTYKNRNGRVSKLLSNIENSVYKRHMLLSYLNYYNGIQPDENETILLSNSFSAGDLVCKLVNLNNKRCDVYEKKYR